MVKNMKLPDGTIVLVEPLTVLCNGSGCEAKFPADTVWPGQAVFRARKAGWLSDFHFLWNRRSREYCPECATDTLRAYVIEPTAPPEPSLGHKYDKPSKKLIPA